MSPRIVRLPDAELDLANLFDYIATDSGNDRAEIIVRRIQQALENLALFPRIGRLREDLEGAPRTFAVWPWLIVYEPLQGEHGIAVWRIVDGRRDLSQLIPGQPRR